MSFTSHFAPHSPMGFTGVTCSKGGGTLLVTDHPPSYRTCIWHCLEKRRRRFEAPQHPYRRRVTGHSNIPLPPTGLKEPYPCYVLFFALRFPGTHTRGMSAQVGGTLLVTVDARSASTIPRVTVHAHGAASRNAGGVSRHPTTRIDPKLQATPSYGPCTWHCLEKR